VAPLIPRPAVRVDWSHVPGWHGTRTAVSQLRELRWRVADLIAQEFVLAHFAYYPEDNCFALEYLHTSFGIGYASVFEYRPAQGEEQLRWMMYVARENEPWKLYDNTIYASIPAPETSESYLLRLALRAYGSDGIVFVPIVVW